MLGDYERALTSCREALAVLVEVGDRDGQAATWDSIGYAHHHLGNHAQAVAAYQHAIEVYRELGHRYGEASRGVSLVSVAVLPSSNPVATLSFFGEWFKFP
jgi:tetratricopeptide (TPR) repeat protein